MRGPTLAIAAIALLGLTTSILAVSGCSSENANQTTSSSSGSGSDILSPCDSCHTQDKTKRLAGGIHLTQYEQTTSAGRATLYAPNLTPDPDTGVGNWTDDQLKFAIRDGVDRDGVVLCPPMQHYKDLSDDKLKEIITAMRKLPPVKNAVKDSTCPPIK